MMTLLRHLFRRPIRLTIDPEQWLKWNRALLKDNARFRHKCGLLTQENETLTDALSRAQTELDMLYDGGLVVDAAEHKADYTNYIQDQS